jgi:hypothetical protein
MVVSISVVISFLVRNPSYFFSGYNLYVQSMGENDKLYLHVDLTVCESFMLWGSPRSVSQG